MMISEKHEAAKLAWQGYHSGGFDEVIEHPAPSFYLPSCSEQKSTLAAELIFAF
jgi:hypothetical protein